MAQTGNKQAVIAYKVRTTDGAPLDINGNPTSESGLKQAIALLQGTINPNPSLYVVQMYFQPDAVLTGNPTVEYDPEDCATGFILVDPEYSNVVAEFGEVALPTADWLTQDWNMGADLAVPWVDTRAIVAAGETLESVQIFADTAGTIRVGYYRLDTLARTAYEDVTVVAGANDIALTFTDAVNAHYVALEGLTGKVSLVFPKTNNIYGAGVVAAALVYNGFAFAYTIKVDGVLNRTQTVSVLSSSDWTIQSKSSFIETDVAAGAAGTRAVAVTVNLLDTEGFIIFVNPSAGLTATFRTMLASNDDWVLATGAWRMGGFWHYDAIFNT